MSAFLVSGWTGQAQEKAPAAKQQTKKKGTKGPAAPDPVPPGGPLTVDALVQMLERIKSGVTTEGRVNTFIEVRGLEFTATEDNLEKLKAAGASEDLLKKISTLSPPPAPPPPPPPVTGTLQFTCAPAECDIRIDGGPDKQTKSGALQIGDLPFKEYTVDFRKEGYMPKSQRIAVTAPSHPEISVTLELAAETRARWGADLYKKCLAALGGLDQIKTMTASGAASSWDAAGTLSEWNIKTTFAGNTYSYELGNAVSGTFSMSCQGETCGPKGGRSPFKGRKISGPEGASLNTNMTQYNRFHLLALLQRIGAGNHKLLANSAPGPAEQHLIADSKDESYDLTLDSTFLPSALTYKSKDGLASVQAQYAEYGPFEKGSKYPKHTSVLLPGDKRHGIQVRYDTLAPK